MSYYYDDGTEFNLDQISKPDLCLKCRKNNKNNIQDGDEEILCNLTRADQAGEEDFQCHGFKPAAE